MHIGSVIVYRERGHLTLGVVQKVTAASGKVQVEVLGEDGKKQVFAPDRVMLDCKSTLPLTLSLTELKKRLQDLRDQIRTHAQAVDLRELWELLKEEAGEEFFWEDLVGFLLSSSGDPLSRAGVLDALWNQNLYFKEKKAGFFAPRDPKSVEESLYQQQMEEQRVRAQSEFIAWAKARLATTAANLPLPAGGDRYLNLLKDLALYGDTYERKLQVLSLFDEIGFRGKGHPWDVAFQLLVALGVWQKDEELCLLRHQIPTRFSVEVLEAAEQTPKFTTDQPHYTDLTSLVTFTIDDPDTTEIDDALSVHEEDGTTLVGIHITDAGFFVPPGGVLDKAALTRGTTVYLPRGKFPMLPPIVSEDRASLVAGTIRPTLSFFASVDAAGHLHAARICRGFIRIERRFTYAEADALLWGSEESGPFVSALRRLSDLAHRRKSFRAAQGAVLIASDEVKVRVNESEVLVSVLPTDSPSHTLVSECMILANEMAAQYCRAHHLPSLYIAQPPPDEPVPAPETFPTQRVYVHAARRLMKPSQIGVTPAPHAALGLDVYTQVTSPLRRYHDLQMQHQIKHHLTQGTALFEEEQLQMIAASAQESSAAAKRCERESMRYWLLRFLETKKGQHMSGQVVREQNGRSFIELDDTLLVVPVSVSPPLPPGTPVKVVIGHVDARRDILSVRLA